MQYVSPDIREANTVEMILSKFQSDVDCNH